MRRRRRRLPLRCRAANPEAGCGGGDWRRRPASAAACAATCCSRLQREPPAARVLVRVKQMFTYWRLRVSEQRQGAAPRAVRCTCCAPSHSGPWHHPASPVRGPRRATRQRARAGGDLALCLQLRRSAPGAKPRRQVARARRRCHPRRGRAPAQPRASPQRADATHELLTGGLRPRRAQAGDKVARSAGLKGGRLNGARKRGAPAARASQGGHRNSVPPRQPQD